MVAEEGTEVARVAREAAATVKEEVEEVEVVGVMRAEGICTHHIDYRGRTRCMHNYNRNHYNEDPADTTTFHLMRDYTGRMDKHPIAEVDLEQQL